MKKGTITVTNPFHPRHEKYAEIQEQVVAMAGRGDYSGIGAVMTGFIKGMILVEDIVGNVIGPELDWTSDSPVAQERLFKAPLKVHGNQAVSIENGTSLYTAKYTGNKIYVVPEPVGTAEFVFDTRDLESGDLVDMGRVAEDAMQSLIIQKTKRLIRLIGMDVDPTTGAQVMTDVAAVGARIEVVKYDGTFTTGTDKPAYIPKLKEKLRRAAARLRDIEGGDVQIRGLCRQFTLEDIGEADTGNIAWSTVAAAEDPNEEGQPIFCEGDIILASPSAADVSKTQNIEMSVKQPDHFKVSYAWRWEHCYIRWDTKYLWRIVIVDTVTEGTLSIVHFDSNYLELFCTKPLKRSTITTATVIVSEYASGEAGSLLTGLTFAKVQLLGDLRRVRITFGGTKPTAGAQYYIRSTTGVQDIGDKALAALAATARYA